MALSSLVRTSMLAVCLTGSTLPGWAEPRATPIADSIKRLGKESITNHDRAEAQGQQRRRTPVQGAVKGAAIGALIGLAVGSLVAAVAARDSGEPNFLIVVPPAIGFSGVGGYLGYQLSK